MLPPGRVWSIAPLDSHVPTPAWVSMQGPLVGTDAYRWLKQELQRQLNLPRIIRLAANYPEIGSTEAHAGHPELHAVKRIEILTAELQVEPSVPAKSIVLE